MVEARPEAADRLLVLEAAACLALAAAGLKLASFRRIVAWASRPCRATPPEDPRRVALRVARAIAGASRRAPWRCTCFADALACQAMLRRRGVPADIHYGARSRGSRGAEAHVWVTSGGVALNGWPEAGAFAELEVWSSLGRRREGRD